METRKPTILFLNIAPSVAHMNDMSELFESGYMGPLAETGQADYETLWVGPWMDTRGAAMDWEVFQRCVEYRPDALYIYGWWLGRNDTEKAKYPALFTFYLIRHLLGIKVVTLLFDLAPRQFEITDNLTRFCDVVFTHEHERHVRAFSRFPDKHVPTNATFSPGLFHGVPTAPRDIDIAFVGGIGGRYPTERANGIAALRDNGLVVTTPGGRATDQVKVSNQEYSSLLKRAKITLNWSRHISGKWFQAKGRIFESTLAGSMLLCEECPEVNAWLEPYVDYVPFSTTEELVSRARYYLEHDNERLQIADQGNRKALSNYDAQTMWAKMLDSIQNECHFDERDAVAGLEKNASYNELKIARYFARLAHEYPEIDGGILGGAVATVESANRSLARRLDWHGWYLGSIRLNMRRRFNWFKVRAKWAVTGLPSRALRPNRHSRP